jgi:hypothetical protein
MKNAMAANVIERASTAAYAFPSDMLVRASVAKPTDGAAPNNPAKLFGLRTSPTVAKNETITPPMRNRMRNCSIEHLRK